MHNFQPKLLWPSCTGWHFLFLILKMPDSAHFIRAIRQPSIQAIRHPCSRATGQPSNQASGQPGSRAVRQPSIQAAKQPSSRAIRQPSSQASEQPSSRATGQPGSQASWHVSCCWGIKSCGREAEMREEALRKFPEATTSGKKYFRNSQNF